MPDQYYDPSMLRFRSIMTPPYADPRSSTPRNSPSILTGGVPSNPQPMDEVPRPFDNPPDISKVSIGQDDGAPEKDTIGQDDEITKLVGKLYTPGHEIADKFNEVWSQMPQREKPSVLRRIVASMVGSAGPKAADQVLDAPYNEARAEWLDKLKMLQPLLSDERYNNANERQIATNAATQSTANRRIAETERHNKEAEDTNRQKLEVTKDRAAVYRYKSEHPDHKFTEDEDGQLMALDPGTGTMKYVLNEDGVPVKSLKNLDAAEKQRLDIQSRENVARIQGANQIAAAKERGAQARETEKTKIQGRKEVKETKDANGEVTSRTTTVYDADNNVTGSRTETFTKKPIKPEGGKVEVPANVSKVKMSAPDGRTIMVPMDKVKEAEQRGAKRVK